MTRVYIGVGSNIDRENSIRKGILALKTRFKDILLSPVYESAAVGFEGDDFYNLVAAFDTDESIHDIESYLHEIEIKFGRSREGKTVSRKLDLDLLLYGDLIYKDKSISLPRKDILEYSFVLKPLADIAGDQLHPESGRSYQELWQEFDVTNKEIKQVGILLDEE